MKNTTKTLIVTAITTIGVAAAGIAHASSAPISDSGHIKFAAFDNQAAQGDVTHAITVEDLTNGNVCGAGC